MTVSARWWHRLDGRIGCDLCPHACLLSEGQKGRCGGRTVRKGQMVLETYGRTSGFAVDPIEKKPLFHFYPGSSVLSFGTVGCNLACRFCQNGAISQDAGTERLGDSVTPQAVVEAAVRAECQGVAFTYNDPVIFAEFALDTAEACRSRGLKTVAVTAGFLAPQARKEFFSGMDAANIDLKAFNDTFYHKICGGRLAPVLETLVSVRESPCWLEVTTLLIPGWNDSDEEITALSRWAFKELGADVPWHFSAFHPDHKMRDVPPTPQATLTRARHLALGEGLRFVYTGNVVDPEGATTSCPGCGKVLIDREGFRIRNNVLTSGCCSHCGMVIPGRFD